jgi:hypothetical protein
MTLIDDNSTTTQVGLWDSIVAVPDTASAADEHIAEFAQTFDAYGVHGSLDRISLVANDVAGAHLAGALTQCRLDDLRTALFMTHQCWSGGGGDATRNSYGRAIVDAIRFVSGGLVRDDRPTRY